MRTYRVRAGSIDDLMHRVDRDFAEALAQEPGFVAYQAMDMGSGKICAVSVFADREQADASNDLAAQWVADELEEFEIERMGVLGGEVMVSRAAADMLVPAHH
ncbi:MAG TPA: antibiotic biosynthesis monooxygenase [Candidatus Limnocylindrales bacterium]|jgi:quinol monooxygenase YgiN